MAGQLSQDVQRQKALVAEHQKNLDTQFEQAKAALFRKCWKKKSRWPIRRRFGIRRSSRNMTNLWRPNGPKLRPKSSRPWRRPSSSTKSDRTQFPRKRGVLQAQIEHQEKGAQTPMAGKGIRNIAELTAHYQRLESDFRKGPKELENRIGAPDSLMQDRFVSRTLFRHEDLERQRRKNSRLGKVHWSRISKRTVFVCARISSVSERTGAASGRLEEGI